MIRVLDYKGHTHNIERVREELDQLHFQAKSQAEIEQSNSCACVVNYVKTLAEFRKHGI